MIDLVMAALSMGLATIAARRCGASPASAALWLWTMVWILRIILPLEIEATSTVAAMIIAVGELGIFVSTLLGRSRPTNRNQEQARLSRPDAARFCVTIALVASACVAGVLFYNGTVEAVTGQSILELSPTEVRAAETGAARSSGGSGALLVSLLPLLACLAVYGAIAISRYWWLLVALVGMVMTQATSRTVILGLVVQVIVFYLYMRSRSGKTSRMKNVVGLGSVSIACLVVFNAVGGALGKSEAAKAAFPGYSWPEWTLSPGIYLTGGVSALSRAVATHVDPYGGPSSIFVVYRVAHIVAPTLAAPDTIADYVWIPVPFNVYTGFGQLFFDFGLIGVLVASILVGWVSSMAHMHASDRSPSSAWISAAFAGMLASLPLGFRFLNLDTVFQVVVGLMAFAFVSRTSQMRRGHSSRRNRPPSPVDGIGGNHDR